MRIRTIAALTILMGSSLVAAPTSATATGCLPEAQVPSRDRIQAQAWAHLPCGGQGDVRLVTASGAILDDTFFYLGGNGYASGSWTNCAGYAVYTSVYVTVNGTGMSDRSGTVSC